MAFRLVLLAAVVLVGTCSYGMPQNFNSNPEQYDPAEARSSNVDTEVPEPGYPVKQPASEDDREDRKLKLLKLAALSTLIGVKGLGVLPAAALGGGLALTGGATVNANTNTDSQIFLSQPAQQTTGITGGQIVFGLPSFSKVGGLSVSGDALNTWQNNVGNLGQNIVSLVPNTAAVGTSAQINKNFGLFGGNAGSAPSSGLILNAAAARAGDAAQEIAAQPEAAADSAQKPAEQFYYVSPVPQYIPYYTYPAQASPYQAYPAQPSRYQAYQAYPYNQQFGYPYFF